MNRLMTIIAAMLTLTVMNTLEAADGLELSIKTPKAIAVDAKTFKDAKKTKELAEKKAKLEAELKTLSKDWKANRDAIMALHKKLGPIQREMMNASGAGGDVKLTLVVKNTGKADATFKYGGDESQWGITIANKGAINLPFKGMMTMDYRMGQAVTIGPGKSKEFTISGLKYGKRDSSRWILTEAGTYTITVSLKSRDVKLTSKPVELTVTAK